MSKNINKIKKKLNLKSMGKEAQGYSLVELILVLAISSFVAMSVLKYESSRAQIQRAEKAGEQLELIGKAVASYMNREMQVLATQIPNGSTQTFVGDVLRGGSEVSSFNAAQTFYGHPILPASFSMKSALGPDFKIQITNNNGNLEGLVVTENSICEDSTAVCGATNPIKYDWIGAAVRKVGPSAGMTYNSANTMTGYNSGWQELNTRFSLINKAGLLGYRIFGTSTGQYDSIYMRLDGTSIMRGNFDMGNYSLRNAANITANDWVRTDSLLANTVRAGNIYVTQNVEARNASFSNNAFIGNDMWVTRDAGIARNLWVGNNTTINKDLWVGGNQEVNKSLLVREDAGVKRDLFVDRDSYFGGQVLAYNNMSAQQLRTNDVLFGAQYAASPWDANPMKASARQIPAGYYLSDMLPRYSSRGIAYVVHGGVVNKPQCPGGEANAKIEIIPQNLSFQGRVLGPLNARVVNSTWVGGYRYDDYNFYQDQYSHGGFSVQVANYSGAWVPYLWVSTYDGSILPASNQTMLAHIYCDLGF